MISTPVLDQISVVLRRAKDAIVLSRRDPQKQQEADEVLNGVIRHLERHFANTKIPPQSKAHHFDLDHIAAHNERVYQELTTTRHRNQLLDEQIKIAVAKLKEEEEALNRMKENKQQWRRRWKSQEKKQVSTIALVSRLSALLISASSTLCCKNPKASRSWRTNPRILAWARRHQSIRRWWKPLTLIWRLFSNVSDEISKRCRAIMHN